MVHAPAGASWRRQELEEVRPRDRAPSSKHRADPEAGHKQQAPSSKPQAS